MTSQTTSGITVIDTDYTAAGVACAYLVVEGNEAAFVENNTNYAIDNLLAALDEQNISPSDVKYLIITHVHLDHAGATGRLLQLCPNAVCLAHPRAARHIIDPSRLVSSAIAVYGEDTFERLYGVIEPAAEDRVRSMNDGEILQWGERSLTFFYTEGHARHHMCIHDTKSNGIFTGDSFGLAYPLMQQHGLFIFPSSSPTDFDPAAAVETIDRITGMNPDVLYLTHFGALHDIKRAARQLKEDLAVFKNILHECIGRPEEERASFCRAALESWLQKKADHFSLDDSMNRLLDMDMQLNADGIAFASGRLPG